MSMVNVIIYSINPIFWLQIEQKTEIVLCLDTLLFSQDEKIQKYALHPNEPWFTTNLKIELKVVYNLNCLDAIKHNSQSKYNTGLFADFDSNRAQQKQHTVHCSFRNLDISLSRHCQCFIVIKKGTGISFIFSAPKHTFCAAKSIIVVDLLNTTILY